MTETEIEELERLGKKLRPAPWEAGPLIEDQAGDFVVWAGRTPKRKRRRYVGNIGSIIQPVLPRTLENMMFFSDEEAMANWIVAARNNWDALLELARKGQQAEGATQ